MRENAVGERRAGLWHEVVMDQVGVEMRHSCRDGIERLSNGRHCAILTPPIAHDENDVRRQRVPQTDQRPPKTAAGEQANQKKGTIRFWGWRALLAVSRGAGIDLTLQRLGCRQHVALVGCRGRRLPEEPL